MTKNQKTKKHKIKSTGLNLIFGPIHKSAYIFNKLQYNSICGVNGHNIHSENGTYYIVEISVVMRT